MKNISGQPYKYLQSVQAYIPPPIAAVFLLGVLMMRLNAKGAIATLLTGFVLGMSRLVAEINQDYLNGLLRSYAEINFLYFAVFLFIICSAVLIVVSLPRKKKLPVSHMQQPQKRSPIRFGGEKICYSLFSWR